MAKAVGKDATHDVAILKLANFKLTHLILGYPYTKGHYQRPLVLQSNRRDADRLYGISDWRCLGPKVRPLAPSGKKIITLIE